MNAAEASILAWFTDREPPVGLGAVDPQQLVSALVVIWPEWMSRLHHTTNAIIEKKYKKIKDVNFGNLHMNRELLMEDLAYRRSLNRIRDDLAGAKWSKTEIEQAIRKIIKRERYYSELRINALVHRVDSLVEYANLRSSDSRSDFEGGAEWVLDPAKKTHTEDCLAMAGKVWSWSVLRFVNPANRHPGCGCHLKPNFDREPLQEAPPEALPSWDMGPVSPKNMLSRDYTAPSFSTLHRSQYT